MKKFIKKILKVVKWTAIVFGVIIVAGFIYGITHPMSKEEQAAYDAKQAKQELVDKQKIQAEKKVAAAAQEKKEAKEQGEKEKVDAEKKAKAEAAAKKTAEKKAVDEQKTAELKVAADKKNAEKLAAQQKSQQDKAERKVNYQAAINQLVDLGNGVIVSIEPEGTNYNYQKMIVSDTWYNSPTYEKQRLADIVHQKVMVNARMYKMVNQDDEVFLDIYDTYGKKVASYSMWSGMKIKE